VKPTRETFTHMLNACAEVGNFNGAETWAGRMQEEGYRLDGEGMAAIARSHAKASHVIVVDEWLERMLGVDPAPEKSTLKRTMKAALDCFYYAQDEASLLRWGDWAKDQGLKWETPDSDTPPKVRRKRGTTTYLYREPAIHADVFDDQEDPLLRSLWEFATAGDSQGAVSVFEEMQRNGHKATIREHNVVLESFAQESQGMPGSAVAWIGKMQEQGIKPDLYSYLSLFKCFASQGDVSGAVGWFESMITAGVQPSQEHFQVLVPLIALSSDPHQQKEYFERIIGSATNEKQKRQRYDLIVRFCALTKHTQLAFEWAGLASKAGIGLTAATLTAAAEASLRAGSGSGTLWWLQQIPQGNAQLGDRVKQFLESRIYNWGEQYKNKNRIDSDFLREADDFVQMMSISTLEPSEVPYETLILAYAQSFQLKKATLWFDRMVSADVTPSAKVYDAIIFCCAAKGDTHLTTQWFERKGLVHNHDASSYGNLVASFCISGDTVGAMNVYEQMLAAGHQPGWLTYYRLVKSHVEAGNLPEALQLARSMAKLPQATGARVWAMQLRAWGASTRDDAPQRAEEVLRDMMRCGAKPGREVLTVLKSLFGRDRLGTLCSELGIDMAVLSSRG